MKPGKRAKTSVDHEPSRTAYVSELAQVQLLLWPTLCWRCQVSLEGRPGPYCEGCDRAVFLGAVKRAHARDQRRAESRKKSLGASRSL